MRLIAAALLLLGACGKPPGGESVSRAREAREMVRRHAREVEPVLDLASARIGEFFAVRFDRIGGFVDGLFSFRGKWRAAFWGRDDRERWVRRAFEREVLRPEDFECEVLARICADFAQACAAEEARVIAEARVLIGPGAAAPEFESLTAEYRRLVAELTPAVRADAAVNLLSIAGSEAVAMALSSALTAAGVCAAGSWWSLGIGLVAGVIAATVVDAAAGDAWEDAARMRVHAELDRLRRDATDRVLGAVVSAWLAHVARQEEAMAAATERSLT